MSFAEEAIRDGQGGRPSKDPETEEEYEKLVAGGPELVEHPGSPHQDGLRVGSSSSLRKRSRRDWVRCREESGTVRRVTRSYTAKQREAAEAITHSNEAGLSHTEWAECMLIDADDIGTVGSNIAEGVVGDDDYVGKKIAVDDAALLADLNGEDFVNGVKDSAKGITCEETKVDVRIIRSDVVGRWEESDAAEMEVMEEDNVLRAEQNGNSQAISNSNDTELITCVVDTKFKLETTILSDVAEEGKEADSDKKEGIKEVLSGADHGKNGSVIARRKTRKHRKWLELEVENRRVLRSDTIKQRVEADRHKKEVQEEVVLGADWNGIGSSISDRTDMELIKCEEEINAEKEKTMRSDLEKQRDESDMDKKEVVNTGPWRKRNRMKFEAKTTRDKMNTDSLKCGQNHTEEIDKKKRKRDSLIHGAERTEIRQDQDPRPLVPSIGVRDFLVGKSMQSKLCKTSRTKAVKMTKNSSSSIGAKRKMFGIPPYKNIRVPGKGGILRVLPSNKKVGGHERGRVKQGKEQNKINLKPSTVAKHDMLKQSLSSSGPKVPKNLSSAVSLGINQSSKGGTSAGKKSCFKSKKESAYIPPRIKAKNLDFSNRKSHFAVKGERSCPSNLPLKSKQKVGTADTDSRTPKQKLRDQIKSMLLNAGWKIDLRPRKGKNYDDSVYISPQGSSYWSITKAYDAFKCQVNCACDSRGKKLSKKSSKTSAGSNDNVVGTIYSFSPIPMKVLSLLKKTVVNRRSKEEIEEARRKIEKPKKKLGVGRRSGKEKFTAKIKCSDSKNSKYRRGCSKRGIKEGDNVGSITKGCVGLSAQRGCALLVRNANQEAETDIDGYVPYVWKRTVLSWMIDLGVMSIDGKVKYMNKRHTRAMLEGMITRDGILCSCCSKILTMSDFESHAGSKLCQPNQNIYVAEAGISLYQCQLNAWEKQEESKRRGFYHVDVDGDDPNDDTCGICGDGGDLICCDACPSTFHLSCLDIQKLPPGDWHCTNCSCRFCGMVCNAAAQESGETVPQLYYCSQCEEKYHQECVLEAEAFATNSDSSCISFCSQSCRKVFERLQSLLGVKNDLEEGFSWSLVQRIDEDSLDSLCTLDQRAECNSKIAVALGVMDECFLPIIDQRSGINLIHNVVYNCGSNFHRLNYRGFYTFILQRGDEIISAACVRIHGTRLAEMPFIGTRSMYRRQGMCRRLLNGIESALSSLNIEKLIIPAISELMDTWRTVFGFTPLEISHKQEIRSMNVLVFPGAGLLLKPLLKNNSVELCETSSGVGITETEGEACHTSDVPIDSLLFSCGVPNPVMSDEALVQHQHEMKEVESSSPGIGGSVHSTAEVSSASLYALHESELKASNTKSLKTTDTELLHLENAYCDDSVVRNNFQVNSPIEHETELLLEGSMQDSHELKNEDAGVAKNMIAGTSVQHTFHAKCSYPNTVSFILQNSCASSAPSANGSSSPYNFEVPSTASNADSSTENDSGKHDTHKAFCFLETSSNSSSHCSSELTTQAIMPMQLEDGFQTCTEHILNVNCNLEDQVTSCKDPSQCPAEVTCVDGVIFDSRATSGGLLNKSSGFTMDMVHDNLTSAHEPALNYSCQPDMVHDNLTLAHEPALNYSCQPEHVSCDGAHDTEKYFSAVERDFGKCSVGCTSEMVNCSNVGFKSTLEAADVRNGLHSSKLFNGSHASAFNVAPMSSGGSDTCEIVEVVNGST